MRDWPDQRSKAHLPWVTATGDLTYFRHTVREIMNDLDFPKEVSFQSFRHGGLTEAGDADLTDRQIQAIGGHRTVTVLSRYVKETEQQRRTAARKRLNARTNAGRLSE
jgi:integrase